MKTKVSIRGRDHNFVFAENTRRSYAEKVDFDSFWKLLHGWEHSDLISRRLGQLGMERIDWQMEPKSGEEKKGQTNNRGGEEEEEEEKKKCAEKSFKLSMGGILKVSYKLTALLLFKADKLIDLFFYRGC